MFESGQRVRLAGERDPVVIDEVARAGERGWTLFVADPLGKRQIDLTNREAGEVEVLPVADAAPGDATLGDSGSSPAVTTVGADTVPGEKVSSIAAPTMVVEATEAGARAVDAPPRSGSEHPEPRRSRRTLWVVLAATLGLVAVAGVVAAVLVVSRPKPRSVYDSFSGQRTSLSGSRPTSGAHGVLWAVPVGSFSVANNAAIADSTASTSIATIDVGSPVRSVRGDLDSVGNGGGFVFRYQDPSNFWSLTAATPYGTWNVYKTIAGSTSYVANTGLTLDPSGGMVEVRSAPDLIQVFVGGTRQQVIFDPALNAATQAGLIASPTAQGTTRWRDITVTGAP